MTLAIFLSQVPFPQSVSLMKNYNFDSYYGHSHRTSRISIISQPNDSELPNWHSSYSKIWHIRHQQKLYPRTPHGSTLSLRVGGKWSPPVSADAFLSTARIVPTTDSSLHAPPISTNIVILSFGHLRPHNKTTTRLHKHFTRTIR